MCLSSMFKQPKIETPAMPAAAPTVVASPTPTSVASQTQLQDLEARKKKQLRSGLLSTMKSGGIFGGGAELSSTGKSTLG
jgi:hypothetical protein